MLAGVSLVTLSACSDKNSTGADIVTMKGDTIRVSDLYAESKVFPSMSTTSLLQNITFNKVFSKEKDITKEVTDKKVDEQYNTVKNRYGAQFSSALQQQGLTESSVKPYLRTQLLEQTAVENDIKKTQYTKANLESAWKDYHPEVEAIVLKKTSKDDATKAIAANKSDAAKFDKDNASSKQKFDSTSKTIPAAVLTATWKLKNGQVSDVISATDTSTSTESYYVVKMVKSSDKGSDMNKYKSQLEGVIKTKKLDDSSYVSSVIAGYLKKYNVTVKETAFSNIFSQYTQTSSSSSSSSK